MYKIINILLFIGVIHTSIFAETTKEDVDKYLEISRGGVILENTYKFRYEAYFSKMYGYGIGKADESMIKKYKTFIMNPKYIDIFYKVFSELDDNSYYEIIAFYKTTLGKKYTQAFKELYERDIEDELMLLIMEKKDKLLLHKKRKLVTEINKAFYEKLYRTLNKNIFVHGNSKAIQKYKLPINIEGEITIKAKKALSDEFYSVFNEIAYRAFSDDELSKILEYAKTYGNIEMTFFHRALNLNTDAFNKDLNKFIKEKALKDKKAPNNYNKP